MLVFEAINDSQYITAVIVWTVILIVATSSFGVVIYYAHRFFTYRRVVVIVESGNKKIFRHSYYKINKEIIISYLKMPKGYEDAEPYMILSKSDISDGSLVSFIMPNDDVEVFFKASLVYTKTIKTEESQIRLYTLPLPASIKVISDKETRPVILMTIEDVKKHLRDTNSNQYFPLNNFYRSRMSDGREVVILYAGELIYSVLIYTDVTFKAFFRSDDLFIKEEMANIDSVTKTNGDIFSTILDTSFNSSEQFLSVLDHAYEYVIYTKYTKQNSSYFCESSTIESSNSEMLALNEEISKELDPVLDRAIEEAKKYQAVLDRQMAKSRELDKEMVTPRDLVYDDLEDIEEYLNPHKPDDFWGPINITEGIYHPKEKLYPLMKQELPDIRKDLSDVMIVSPSSLDMNNVIDYIMSRKDMVSLTIDVSPDINKSATTMKFLSSSFALITKGQKSYRVSMKLNDDYVMNDLVKIHPNIIHIRNGNDETWYKLVIDDTYYSYEELYNIFLHSYDFAKTKYYQRYK